MCIIIKIHLNIVLLDLLPIKKNIYIYSFYLLIYAYLPSYNVLK